MKKGTHSPLLFPLLVACVLVGFFPGGCADRDATETDGPAQFRAVELALTLQVNNQLEDSGSAIHFTLSLPGSNGAFFAGGMLCEPYTDGADLPALQPGKTYRCPICVSLPLLPGQAVPDHVTLTLRVDENDAVEGFLPLTDGTAPDLCTFTVSGTADHPTLSFDG